jgi:hypothetical protein
MMFMFRPVMRTETVQNMGESGRSPKWPAGPALARTLPGFQLNLLIWRTSAHAGSHVT